MQYYLVEQLTYINFCVKNEWYRNHPNNSNHPIIQTPPHPVFRGKCLAFEHPRLKLLFQYPNTYIATPCGAWTGVAERLLAFDSLCRATARVNECFLAYYRGFRTSTRLLLSLQSSNGNCQSVPAFDSFCGAQTGVAKRVIAFDGLCGARTGVAKRAIAFDSLCGARTGIRECLLAFDRPSYIN